VFKRAKKRIASKVRTYRQRLPLWLDMGRCGVLVCVEFGIAALFFADHPDLLHYWWLASLIAVLVVLAVPLVYTPKRPAEVEVAAITGTLALTTTGPLAAACAAAVSFVPRGRGALAGVVGGGIVVAVAALTQPWIGAIVFAVELGGLGAIQLWKRLKRPKVQAGGDGF
jgi:hypothetical protein